MRARMGRASKCGVVTIPVLVTIAIVILNTIQIIEQVAHGQEEIGDRFAQVQPFDDATHLPADRIERLAMVRSDRLPSLGYFARLDTLAKPGMSVSAPTEFSIYTQGRGTRGIEFRANAPQTITGRPRNAAHDFQYNLEAMAASGFDVTRRTVVMIPGYMNKDEVEWALCAKDFWLQLCLGANKEAGVNVLVVTWPASQAGYSQAVADTVFVARQVTVFLHYLAQLGGTNLRDQNFLDRLHLVGHSLGAHIAGFVGQDLGGHVGRITGLDPAGPSFDKYATDQRLNRDQAQLVEILHTNAGQMKYVNAIAGAFLDKIISWLAGKRPDESGSWFGINQQLGHVDYYANNGQTQEGCTDVLHSCDHRRATEIYVDLLRREVQLRTGSRDQNQSESLAHGHRLWAFQADNFATFETGAQFDKLCPEMMQLEAHLDPKQVAKNYARCALPLMDFWKPLDELIRELRNEFGVDFDPRAWPEARPRYYFKTQMNSKTDAEHLELLGDPYLLKVYLEPNSTAWNPEKCLLSAHLQMADGEQVKLELSDLRAGQSILAMPFAHPAGHRAHADLSDLLSRVQELESKTVVHREQIAVLLRQLFPTRVELEVVLPARRFGMPDCRVGLKWVEVHPVSAFTSVNIGAASGRQTENIASTSEFAEQLARAPMRAISNKSPVANRISVPLDLLLVH